MATPTKQLWSKFGGKGFSAEHAKYAERATTDEQGNNLTLTVTNSQVTAIGGKLISAVTPAEMTGATASTDGESGLVPAPAVADKDKFLKGDGTWTTISMTEQRVDILNKTTGLTEADFDTAWTNLENRHLVGVWLDDHLFMVTWKYIYSGNFQKRIIFTSIENNHWVEHTFGGITYKYIAWYRGNTSLTSSYYNIIPDPVNHGGQFLKSNGSAVEWGSVKQVPSSAAADEGKVLTVNSSGNAAWSTVSPYAPAPSADNTLLLGDQNGNKTWTALENDVFGTPLLDENDQPILDETQTPPTIIYDASASTDLWTGFAGKGFGASRAYADQDGHNIKATYATKSSVDTLTADLESALDTLNDTIETVSHAGMYDLGTKTESDLNNGKLAIGCGNSTTELTLTTVNSLTVLANSGVANFALLVDNSGNSNDVTVTVKDSTDTTTFYHSTAAGNKVSAGKICQITCVGKCWTLAEFEAPA